MTGLRRLALLAMLGLLACRAADSDAPVHLRVWAPGGAEPHFEISAETCPMGCPFVVALVDGELVRSRIRLKWARAEGVPTLGPPDASAGAGDPLDPEALEREASEALYTGDEAGAVITVARGLALGSGTTGLLVDQVAGFEHVKRAHFLFVVSGEQLRQAWRYEEPAGPTWSTTVIASPEPERQVVVLLAASALAGELRDRPDEVSAERVEWDPASRTAVARPLGETIAAVRFGRFTGIAAALDAQDAHADCLGDFWLLPAERLSPSGPQGEFALALLGVSEAGARSRLADTAECARDLEGSIAALRP